MPHAVSALVPSSRSLRASLVLGVGLALGACGGGGDEATAPAPTAPATVAPTPEPAPPSAPATPPPTPAPGPSRIASTNVSVRFVVSAVPSTGDNPPQSTVEIVLTGDDGQVVRSKVVEFPAECVVQDTPEHQALITTRCWWAGAGLSVHAFREGDVLVVRKLALFEEAAENLSDAVETNRFTLVPGATLRADVTP